MALIKTAPMLPREWIPAAGVCISAFWWTRWMILAGLVDVKLR